MPELPEVETVRRGLAARVRGRRIVAVTVGRDRAVRRVGAAAVIAGLEGAAIEVVRRRGKYLLADLDNGARLMIHLGMSGRIVLAPGSEPRPLHSHVVVGFAGSAGECEEMRFVDPRTFGEVAVYDQDDEARIVPELARLGVDPVAEEFDARVLFGALDGRRGALKPLLLSQRAVAGIGNIYADEILHRARLRWDRTVPSLGRRGVGALARWIPEVLNEAIEAGGSTLADAGYADVEGRPGSFAGRHLVYGRAGDMCLTCRRARIVRVVAAGRSTSYCPRCQR